MKKKFLILPARQCGCLGCYFAETGEKCPESTGIGHCCLETESIYVLAESVKEIEIDV